MPKETRRAAMKRILNSATEQGLVLQGDNDAFVAKECIDAGYLVGVKAVTLASGRVRLHYRSGGPMVTAAGHDFLAPNKTEIKATVALWLSGFAILFSVLATLDRMLENYHLLANALKALLGIE